MGKLTIAVIVFKLNSAIGKILAIYYIKYTNKCNSLVAKNSGEIISGYNPFSNHNVFKGIRTIREVLA